MPSVYRFCDRPRLLFEGYFQGSSVIAVFVCIFQKQLGECMQKEKDISNNKVILNSIQDLQRASLINNIRGRFRIKYETTPLLNNSAFTLIEILVVILIIAILAAIAVPQYQKAVKRADFAKYKAIVHTLYQAETDYYLIHGQYTDNIDQLDITLPIPTECTLSITNTQRNYACKKDGKTYLSYGVYDYKTNVQAGGNSIAFLRFFTDSSSPYKAKRGDYGCWARGKIAREICESLGTWDKKITNRSPWEHQYIFSTIK